MQLVEPLPECFMQVWVYNDASCLPTMSSMVLCRSTGIGDDELQTCEICDRSVAASYSDPFDSCPQYCVDCINDQETNPEPLIAHTVMIPIPYPVDFYNGETFESAAPQ